MAGLWYLPCWLVWPRRGASSLPPCPEPPGGRVAGCECFSAQQCITSSRESRGDDQSKLHVVTMADAPRGPWTLGTQDREAVACTPCSLSTTSRWAALSCCQILSSNSEALTGLSTRGKPRAGAAVTKLRPGQRQTTLGTNSHIWALRSIPLPRSSHQHTGAHHSREICGP